MKEKIQKWFWFDTGDYSIVNGEIKFWEKNWLTGYSRIKDTFTGKIVLKL